MTFFFCVKSTKEGKITIDTASVYFDLLFCVKSLNSIKSTKEGKITIDMASVYFDLLFLRKKLVKEGLITVDKFQL